MSKKIEIVKARRKDGVIEYETPSINSYFCINGEGMTGGAIKGEKALTHSFLMDSFRKLMGKTLTIVDASVHDKMQNKAIKDLIRDAYSNEINFASEIAFDQEVLQKQATEYFENIPESELENHTVDIEDVLGVEK